MICKSHTGVNDSARQSGYATSVLNVMLLMQQVYNIDLQNIKRGPSGSSVIPPTPIETFEGL